LRDEDPFAIKEDTQVHSDAKKEELKVSSYVVDLQIPAPVSEPLPFNFFCRRKF
jgi:hypothetical protein